MRVGIFLQDSKGATAVEMALVLPALLSLIFGIIEGGRALWTLQALQETAYSTARCMAVGDTSCDTVAEAKSYAAARAAKSQIGLPLSAISITEKTTCDGISDMAKVSFVLPYNSPAGQIIPALRSALETSACMPVLSAS